jgi:hypothetical protein
MVLFTRENFIITTLMAGGDSSRRRLSTMEGSKLTNFKERAFRKAITTVLRESIDREQNLKGFWFGRRVKKSTNMRDSSTPTTNSRAKVCHLKFRSVELA